VAIAAVRSSIQDCGLSAYPSGIVTMAAPHAAQHPPGVESGAPHDGQRRASS